ncbi:SDR family oxidoreductase [Candidatus Aminicenantes bacterium AC-334-K16]|jgi:UDP-glucose 4-epimerase|nr:SDR family oxidoreductase [Candidatus Aminicenantes bacterium AC-334-K16]
MRCLVTGGAGFIGSHLVEGLLKRGHFVRVVDNFLTGKRENLEDIQDKIDFIEGDIRDFSLCREIIKGIDWVFHQAALPSVPRSVEEPRLSNEINVTGTLNLLTAAHESGVKKFIFASSSSVYGDNPNLPKKEDVLGQPLSPYAVSKRVGELYCQVFYQLYGLSTICLRYFNIFGPRQDPHSQYAAVIPNFINRMLEGKQPVIFGDGHQSRDFTFVANVVEANIRAAEAGGEGSRIFNIACGQRITILELVTKINEILGKKIQPIFDPPRPGDIEHSYADINLARKYLGYQPVVKFETGLRRTIEWYQQRRSQG